MNTPYETIGRPTATYCPEDNKLRIYCGRVPREQYEEFRELGFKSTPKQDCDFVATWNIPREDHILGMIHPADTIGDEAQGPDERAADRAERFAEYRDKRRAEAHGYADRYESGSSAAGYQSQQRAERAAARRDRIGGRAVSQWDKAEYWQRRTAGVIDHALYQMDAHTRRGRIARLDRELSRAEKYNTGQYSRYIQHLKFRLQYEKTMLEAEGGNAADIELEPAGWINGMQIVRVNRSQLTKKPVSVLLIGDGPKYTQRTQNIERMAADAYTPPTNADRQELQRRKAGRQAQPKTKTLPLLNPSIEDAQRIQDLWNKTINDERAGKNSCMGRSRTEIEPMKQAHYSRYSRGDMCRTMFLSKYGACQWRRNEDSIARIRVFSRIGQADGVVSITDKKTHPVPVFETRESEAANV